MEIADIQQTEIDPAKLKEARGNRAPSEVARAVDIPYTHLWAIEKGSRNPSALVFIKLCLLYGVQIDQVVSQKKIAESVI